LTTELDTALAVGNGMLSSPRQLFNSYYVNLRISGTGVAWRDTAKEYVYRDPMIWLSDEMRRRVLGLPVIIEHPSTDVMSSRYFGERVVGFIVASMVRRSGLWGTARIIDETACNMIIQGLFDTSPAVVLNEGSSAYVDVDDKKLLIESSPIFIDHLALVYTGSGNKGVWQRSNGPGVEVEVSQSQSDNGV
jgi:hypothetical protein